MLVGCRHHVEQPADGAFHTVFAGADNGEGELVAGQPGDDAGFGQRVAEPVADLGENHVTGTVSESVVDLFEPNQVKQDQPRRCVEAA